MLLDITIMKVDLLLAGQQVGQGKVTNLRLEIIKIEVDIALVTLEVIAVHGMSEVLEIFVIPEAIVAIEMIVVRGVIEVGIENKIPLVFQWVQPGREMRRFSIHTVWLSIICNNLKTLLATTK